jgi:FkbM family methyltransferase
MIGIDRSALTAAAVKVLARRTPYLESEMLGLSSLVGPGNVCLDVGSATGLYTLLLSKLVGPTGMVHSFEPLPLSFVHPVVTRVLAARKAANVGHHTLALGTKTCTDTMSVPIGNYGPVTGRSFLESDSSGLGSNAEFAEHIDVVVKVDTLDAFRDREDLQRLDLVKIDVEGAELRVLEGGERAIKEFRPALLVEIEARHTERYQYEPADIVDWLTQLGYTMHVWRDGWHETTTVQPDIRNYLFRVGGSHT